MASSNNLKNAAVKIGKAVGKADARAHQAARKASKAVSVAKSELHDLAKQVEALKKQLAKSSRRLQDALK
jgi:predicted HAD superfamily Cof-like phosphohydrolase